MPKGAGQKLKLYYLSRIMLEKTDEDHMITMPEIKKALEQVFPSIKVARVNTLRTLGKIKRQGVHSGRTPEVKKAYVVLTEDSKPIEFFEGMV